MRKCRQKLLMATKTKKLNKFMPTTDSLFRSLSRFTKHLVISDSTYKFVKQGDISNETAIHSYPLATISVANNIIDSYSAGTKPESLVFHLGHNAIDQGTDGKRAAEQMGDLVSRCLTKFKPHKVAICLIPHVKNGLYGRDSNYKEIDAYNQEFNSLAGQIRGEFQWSNVYVLNYGLEANDIRQDGVHPIIYGIQKMVTTLRKHMKNIGYNCSSNDISLKQMRPKQQKGNFLAFKRGWNNFNSPNEF